MTTTVHPATRPTLNRALLLKTLGHVLLHPEQHDQAWWRHVRGCGTTMCFGGWACELAGGRWITRGYSFDCLLAESEDDPATTYLDGEILLVGAHDRAQRVLGLTDYQAEGLFQASYRIEEVVECVSDILNGISV